LVYRTVQVMYMPTISLGRIARTTYVDAAYCYRPSRVVCLSVCHTSELCKAVEPIEMPFGLRTRVGPENHVLDGGPDPYGKGQFWGKGRPLQIIGIHSAVSCAKTAEPIDLPFGLWTQVGRRQHKFNRIRQVAPTCLLRGHARWRHLANTTEPSVFRGDATLL